VTAAHANHPAYPMSWYVDQEGQQIWIARDETVFTVIEVSGKLPTDNLTYLTVHSKKAAYQEHLIKDDILVDGKSKVPRRRREQQAGQQRGFIVRVEVEDAPLQRVVPVFKAAAHKLIDDTNVSRIDADDPTNSSRSKKKEKG